MKATTKLSTTEQIRATNRLLLQFDTPNVDLVQGLELPTPRTKKEIRDDGAFTEDSLRGYGFLLECYKTVNYATLDAASEKEFDKHIRTISELKEERAFLRTIHKAYDSQLNNELYDKSKRNTAPYHQALENYAADKYSVLRSTGEAFLIGGYNGHHVIIKLEKKGLRFFHTTYNAGSESVFTDADLVMGVCKREIVQPTRERLIDLIRTTAEKKLRRWDRKDDISSKNHALLTGDLATYLGPIIAHQDVTPQHKGNCTTRSTREFLRAHLSENTFESVYAFVSDTPSTEHQIMLTDHQLLLEQQLQKEAEPLPRANDASLYAERLAFLQRKAPVEILPRQKPAPQLKPAPKDWQSSLRQPDTKPVRIPHCKQEARLTHSRSYSSDLMKAHCR